MKASLLVHQISRLYTLDPDSPDLGEAAEMSVAFTDGELSWIGPAVDAPSAKVQIDGRGLIGLPGLVEPHTHAIWAGSRSDEFARRLAGETYIEILEKGGGILSTVRQTRESTLTQLLHCGRARIRGLRSHGVTTVEIKSGYGLNVDTGCECFKLPGR